MVIRQGLREGTALLDTGGSPSARLDAEVLLAHTLDCRRVDLYVKAERPLTEGEMQDYRALLQRRLDKEPVAYIVGQKAFFGLDFFVDQRVLIPRPETEVLVQRALEWAQSWGREIELRIADIGTGSGCIAVALARHLPQARLYATECSVGAAEVAQKNFARHGVSDRIALRLGDLCQPLPEAVDLLVANPPYTVWESLPEGIASYEPRIALNGGVDGLSVYRRLMAQMPPYLRPGGTALLEIGDGQAQAVKTCAQAVFSGVAMRFWPDYGGIPRVLEIGPIPTTFARNSPPFVT